MKKPRDLDARGEIGELITVDLRYSSADYVVGLLPYVEPICSNRYVGPPHCSVALQLLCAHAIHHVIIYDLHRHDIYSARPGPRTDCQHPSDL